MPTWLDRPAGWRLLHKEVVSFLWFGMHFQPVCRGWLWVGVPVVGLPRSSVYLLSEANLLRFQVYWGPAALPNGMVSGAEGSGTGIMLPTRLVLGLRPGLCGGSLFGDKRFCVDAS